MLIAQYFVEFIFYSFLGWVWESIYCTAKEKAWQDRGFLFGPICPIYGSCVVVAEIIFSQIPAFSSPDLPIWEIFLICMVGSAIAEFGTSWVLEKRFHARWWDYSKVPLNIQGRICLPVSIGFGVAGVVVVKYLIPAVSGVHTNVHGLVYEAFALVFAMVLGADFALTEASLSTLLKTVEEYKKELNERAETTYENIQAAPKKLQDNITAAPRKLQESIAAAPKQLQDRVAAATERISERYIPEMNVNEKRILGNIRTFTPRKGEKLHVNNAASVHFKMALHQHRHDKHENKSGKAAE